MALRERELAPAGLLDAILTFRAYAHAKDAWERALRDEQTDKLPTDWPMLNLVKSNYASIHAEILEARLKALEDKA